MIEEGFIEKTNNTEHAIAIQMTYFFQMMLAFIFGDYQMASEMGKKCRKSQEVLMCSVLAYDIVFYDGLSSIANAAETTKEQSKWIILAKRANKKLKHMALISPSNCSHKSLLLES